MRKASLSTIPVYYDYQRMSPSSSTTNVIRNESNQNYYDGAGSSLFGDPVPPPPEDFLDNLDNHLYGNIRQGCYTTDFDELSKTQTYFDKNDECPKPALRHLPSNVLPIIHDLNSTYTVNERLRSPRLPPDIQILPDSGESSSENRNSPNYPSTIQPSARSANDSLCAMERYLNTNTSEDMTRRYSGFSEDFNMNISMPRQSNEIEMLPQPSTRRLHQQNSNDSYSSQEWFKPSHDYQEFTKIPRLRPSSKNILSISHSKKPHDSPVATLINDSNGSSGSEERLTSYKRTNFDDYQQADPSSISPRTSESLDIDANSPKLHKSNKEMRRGSVLMTNNVKKSTPENTPERPELPLTSLMEPRSIPSELNREVTPVIFTDCITTGADHRLEHHRSHKKSSFTIIAEKSPQSSRVPSPLAFPPTERLSPFLGHGFKEPIKPVAMPRQLQKKSLSASHLTLPTIVSSSNNINTSDDSPRPSVQFDISSRHDRSSPIKVPPVQKSILQLKQQENAAKSLPLASQMPRIKSYENLPLLTDRMTSKSRRGSMILTKSNGDLSTDSQFEKVTRPVFKNSNPTRKQKGLLQIVNSEESRTKIQSSNWASLDDLSIKPRPMLAPITKSRRRSSSTSPERRSSTQTEPRSSIASDRRSSHLSSITTSDFSFRRNSVSPPKAGGAAGARRKSIFQSTPKKTVGRSVSYLNISRTPRKVAKPTTLSPIIGTPNKDSQLSSEDAKSGQARLTRSSSISKIPVRGNSRGTSRSNSRVGSRSNSRGPSLANSRTSSPQKELHSRPTSRIEHSLSPSRTNTRSESRGTSRAGSRAELRTNDSRNTSRGESHAPSTLASKNSSRANSRLGLQTEKLVRDTDPNRSRSTSQFSKNEKNYYKKGSTSPPKGNSKRRSPSPRGKRQKSNSPPKRSRSQGRRSSRSRIPARIVTKQKSKSVSPPKIQYQSPERSSTRKIESSAKKATKQIKKSESIGKLASSTVNKDVAFKRESSNLKRSSINLKREQSSLQKTASNLKRDPSRLSLKKSGTGTAATSENSKKITESKPGNMKREQSNMVLKTNGSKKSLLKSRTDSNVSKKLEKKSSFKNEKKTATGDGNSGRLSSEGKSTPASVHGNSGLVTPLSTRKVTSQNEQSSAGGGGVGSGGSHEKSKSKLPSRSPTPTTSPAGQMLISEDLKSLPNAILEKSQKTLETIQKTVTDATDEIHKTINENLTDLKSMESGMGHLADGFGTPIQFEKSENLKTILETTTDSEKSSELIKTAKSSDLQIANKTPLHSNQPIEASVSVINSQNTNKSLTVPANQINGSSNNSGSSPTKSGGGGVLGGGVGGGVGGVVGGGIGAGLLNNNIASKNGSGSKNDQMAKEEDMAERVSERAISVLPEVECESANLQNFDVTTAAIGTEALADNDEKNTALEMTKQKTGGIHSELPTAMDGGEHADNNNGSGSQEFLGETDKESPRGCCNCCTRICLPCRRWQMCRCCRKSKKTDSETAAVILDEIDEKPQKPSCWKRMKCCKRKSKTSDSVEEILGSQKMDIIAEDNEPSSVNDKPPKRNKCGLCLRKFFCCRPTNKVETSTVDVEKPRMCCFCIPCRKKKSSTTPDRTAESQIAWQNTETNQSIENTENILNEPEVGPPPVQGSRCSRFMNKLKCWKKKQPSESRRQSVKQGAAPTLADDTRSKLHVDLVEFNSKMKGAIPVMPLYLAWLCAICNTLVPGLGTVLSGFFCLCVGIPRFSQYDSAKARFGSFFINCIVGVAQLFCVLFCFVGWGWSIWWGTIMLKTARKLKKIKRVEILEMEEDRRQAAAAAIATTATKTAEKDVEAAKPTSS